MTKKNNKPVFPSGVKQEAAHHEVGVPYFGEVISSATTALAVVIANWGQHRRVIQYDAHFKVIKVATAVLRTPPHANEENFFFL